MSVNSDNRLIKKYLVNNKITCLEDANTEFGSKCTYQSKEDRNDEVFSDTEHGILTLSEYVRIHRSMYIKKER